MTPARIIHLGSLTGALRAASMGVGLLALSAGSVHAQNIDGALAAYKANDYPEAAARFYEVLKFDTDEGNQAEAEYGLAQSFQKMGLHFPAIKYYENIIQAGNSHTYYFRAFEGLLDSGDALNDDLKVPQVLDKAYGKPLAKLESGLLQRIHFALGEVSFRKNQSKEARSFLNTIKPGNKTYAKAQYLLALMKLGMGQRGKNVQPDRPGALKHLANVLKETEAAGKKDVARAVLAEAGITNSIPMLAGVVGGSAGDPQQSRLRVLAQFAVARVEYEEAAALEEDDPKRKERLKNALAMYDEIERLGPDWGQALFEKSYALFQLNEYGQALGVMHTLTSPTQESRYQPEMHVLRSLVYFFNCHYDRVYKTLSAFETEYKPLLEGLKKVRADEGRDSELWYDLLKKSIAAGPTHSNPDLIPGRVAAIMAQDDQWLKLDGSVQELEKELKKVKSSGALSDGPLGEELTQLLEDARKNFVKISGKTAQRLAKAQEDTLQDFMNQGTLVRLETQTAEQGWLEAGRKLQAGVIRRRLPRPFIPDDTYIYWSWRNEYWADEVGYYRFAIKSECID
jgi:tetratricopeptide (TPR) repeat protein